jgi:hypothetical protein
LPVAIDDAATGMMAVTVTANVPHQVFFDGSVWRLEF